MGADLYMLDDQGDLPSGDDDAEYERRYFRDSYNAGSLLWAVGLSWWVDVQALLDERHLLLPDKARQLLEMVESRELPTPQDLVKGDAFQSAVIDDGKNSPQVWWTFIAEKRTAFLDFLRRAIDTGAPIYCSI